MAKIRKPRPKTQKEISIDQHDAYDVRRGNPNKDFGSNESETGIPFKRSTKLSYKGDNVKPFSIGLKDINDALFYYLKKEINPSIIQNGNRVKVPIIYSSQERWKSFIKDGWYRDKKGAMMLPILAIQRSNIKKDRSKTNKLDSNNSGLYVSFQKTYNPKNMYSNFSALNNRIPTKQFEVIVIPDYVTITYNCVIQTYYMEQLDKIIEAFEYASDSYWGDPERFRFKAFADDFTTIVELQEGKDRVVKSNFNIRLNGYIIPDILQKDLNSIQKFNSKSKIIIQMETTSNADIFDPNVEKLKDGRTRRRRKVEGRITSLGDIIAGREVRDPDPGSDLRE